MSFPKETALKLSLEFHSGSHRSAASISPPTVDMEAVIADAEKILQFLGGEVRSDDKVA